MRRSWTDEDLRAAVARSKSYKATLEQLGLNPRGSNHYEIKTRIQVLGLDVDGRLPIELDYINGDHDDNRIENLRVLCPNCHSLQPTHRGSNKRKLRGGR